MATFFTELPQDVRMLIASKLDIPSFACFLATNKEHALFGHAPIVLKALVQQHFGITLHSGENGRKAMQALVYTQKATAIENSDAFTNPESKEMAYHYTSRALALLNELLESTEGWAACIITTIYLRSQSFTPRRIGTLLDAADLAIDYCVKHPKRLSPEFIRELGKDFINLDTLYLIKYIKTLFPTAVNMNQLNIRNINVYKQPASKEYSNLPGVVRRVKSKTTQTKIEFRQLQSELEENQQRFLKAGKELLHSAVRAGDETAQHYLDKLDPTPVSTP